MIPALQFNVGATCEDLNEANDNDKNINDEDRLDGQSDDIDVKQIGEEIEYSDYYQRS